MLLWIAEVEINNLFSSCIKKCILAVSGIAIHGINITIVQLLVESNNCRFVLVEYCISNNTAIVINIDPGHINKFTTWTRNAKLSIVINKQLVDAINKVGLNIHSKEFIAADIVEYTASDLNCLSTSINKPLLQRIRSTKNGGKHLCFGRLNDVYETLFSKYLRCDTATTNNAVESQCLRHKQSVHIIFSADTANLI